MDLVKMISSVGVLLIGGVFAMPNKEEAPKDLNHKYVSKPVINVSEVAASPDVDAKLIDHSVRIAALEEQVSAQKKLIEENKCKCSYSTSAPAAPQASGGSNGTSYMNTWKGAPVYPGVNMQPPTYQVQPFQISNSGCYQLPNGQVMCPNQRRSWRGR